MRCVAPVLVVAVIGLVVWVNAGDLTPPPGPPAPTMKPLSQVEARIPVQSLPGDADAVHVINEPGSYYLTGNITGVTGKSGIKIETTYATLDLNGFSLLGIAGTLDGINFTAYVGQVIRNGTIANWGRDGLGGYNQLYDSMLEGLTLGYNGQDGCLGLNRGTVLHCTATHNGRTGFSGLSSCQVTRCVAASNGEDGFHIYDGRISECVADSNTGDGVWAMGSSQIVENTCNSNAGAGIYVSGSGNRVEANLVTQNYRGIEVTGTGNLIIKNSSIGQLSSDYVFAAGNTYGPIISTAFSGDLSTVTNGSNPWANFAHGCEWGETGCGGECKNLSTDVSNCGACGNICTTSTPHTHSVCWDGNCEPRCDSHWGNCDQNWENGCETDLLANDSHCGMCGRQCTGGTRCTNGVCQ